MIVIYDQKDVKRKMDEVAIKIKEIRLKNNLSQEKFAKSLGFSKSYIADIETGRTNVSRNLLEAVLKQYGTSADWLLTRNKILFFLNTARAGLFFVYGFTQREIDRCEASIIQLFKDKDYMLIDALGMKSANQLLRAILNKSGWTGRLFKELNQRFLTSELIMIIKNLSRSKIPQSGFLIGSIFKSAFDSKRIYSEKLNISDKNKIPLSAVIILDYASFLEKNINFLDLVMPIREDDIQTSLK